MSRLLNTGERFKFNLKKVTGEVFTGQILEIPDTSRVSNFLSTRRYLRTKPTTTVKPTDVVVANGVKFIVAEHGDGFHKGPIYKHFKLFEVTDTLNWYKTTSYTDDITGLVKSSNNLQLTKAYLSIQPKSEISDSIKIPIQTQVAISNIELARDEQVGEYIVTKVDKVLGVYVLELRGK